MTPAVNNRVIYVSKINQLKKEIAEITGVAVADIKVHKYGQEDDGWYEEGKTFAGLTGVNRVHNGELAVFFREKVHTHTGADGYGLMEFSRNQDGTKSRWRVYYEAEKIGERSFDPVPAGDGENQDE
ncbi:MAG: hypothetical protein MMC23_009782 [Stictis urceolatum]|nr:hypothetical protein [Stictis urceolata]